MPYTFVTLARLTLTGVALAVLAPLELELLVAAPAVLSATLADVVVPLAAASADEELLPESLQAASARMTAQSAARLTAVFRMMMSPSTEPVVGHHL